MEVKSVHSEEFAAYGRVLTGYDFTELFAALDGCNAPDDAVEYVPGVKALEDCAIYKELTDKGFGGLPIQVGYCNGVNNKLNCLEYHKSSEFNITNTGAVLLLALESEIIDGKLDTSKVKAFHVPAGCGVEVYGTTLHYAPCGVNPTDKFRVVIVLPKGTNYDKPAINPGDDLEAKMLFASNKWLLAHPESDEAKTGGAYVGLVGENVTHTGI